MEDLKSYSLNAIYEMMRNGTISLNDLRRYMVEVAANMEHTDELAAFVQAANDYYQRKQQAGTAEQTNRPPEEGQSTKEEEPEDKVINNLGETERKHQEHIERETAEAREKEQQQQELQQQMEEAEETKKQEEIEEQQKAAEESEEVVVDEPTPAVEEPEPVQTTPEVTGDELYMPVETEDLVTLNRDDPRLEAKRMMEETYKYSLYAGLNVTEITLDGKDGRGPHISFELNNESKQYIENMMATLSTMPGINMELMRSAQTKQEFFTIQLSEGNISQEQMFEEVRSTFEAIYETIENTRRDRDYEKEMSDGMREWKSHFRNDDPDIDGDITIGYVRGDGKDTYYVLADDPIQAENYAREIGYSVKAANGAGIYEVETMGSAVNTKLEAASIDLSTSKQVMDINDDGISNLDIYGGLGTDPKVTMITDFIDMSPSTEMSMVEITVPPENPNQRVVHLRAAGSSNDTVVFTDGDSFDKKVLPKIAEDYAEQNRIEEDNIQKSPGENGTTNVTIDSENNTQLAMTNYSEAVIDETIDNMAKQQGYTDQQAMEMKNTKQKVKTYNISNKSNEESQGFVSVPVLICIISLLLLSIALLIFAS